MVGFWSMTKILCNVDKDTQSTIIVLSLRIFEVQTWSFDQVWFYPFEVSSKNDEICVNMNERYLLTSDSFDEFKVLDYLACFMVVDVDDADV